MPSQTYKKLDLFQSVDYWDNISDTEYQHIKASPTNKPITYLDNNKKNMNTFFKAISVILQLIIDEYIILYRTAKSTSPIFDPKLIKYCWTYIRKTDKTQTVHSYFIEQVNGREHLVLTGSNIWFNNNWHYVCWIYHQCFSLDMSSTMDIICYTCHIIYYSSVGIMYRIWYSPYIYSWSQ